MATLSKKELRDFVKSGKLQKVSTMTYDILIEHYYFSCLKESHELFRYLKISQRMADKLRTKPSKEQESKNILKTKPEPQGEKQSEPKPEPQVIGDIKPEMTDDGDEGTGESEDNELSKDDDEQYPNGFLPPPG